MEATLKTIGLFLKKYLAQILVIVVGLLILYVGLIPDADTGLQQNSLFTLGGVGLIIAGVVSTLYIAELINRLLHNILMYGVLPVLAIAYFYMDYRSIKDEMEWIARVERTQTEVKQRLKDIRDAQVEFRNTYGHFAPTFDSLKWFVSEGKAMDIQRFGDVPQNIDIDMAKALGYKEIPEKVISETEAWILMKKGFISPNEFRRDTSYRPVMEKLFNNDNARANRTSMYAFSVDSLDVAPFGLGKFEMKTGKILKNNIEVPVFMAKETQPLIKDTLIIGSLTEVNTNGNWGE